MIAFTRLAPMTAPVPPRPQWRVGRSSGSVQAMDAARQFSLAGRADGDVSGLLSVFALQFFDHRVIVEQLEAVVDRLIRTPSLSMKIL